MTSKKTTDKQNVVREKREPLAYNDSKRENPANIERDIKTNNKTTSSTGPKVEHKKK